MVPTKVYPLVLQGSMSKPISFVGMDVQEIIHCWQYGCFSISSFWDLVPAPLYGCLTVLSSELICLGVLCSSLNLMVGTMIAYVGTFPQVCYFEASKAAFASVGLSTRVFGSKIFRFKSHCIKTRSDLGRGQCFWRAISSSQGAWRRAKQHSLASLLPFNAHLSQLHHSAWATHLQIASYAEAYQVRVILLTLDHQRVLHFVPSQFLELSMFFMPTIFLRRLLGFLAKPMGLGAFLLSILGDVMQAFLKRSCLTLELLLLFRLVLPCMELLLFAKVFVHEATS